MNSQLESWDCKIQLPIAGTILVDLMDAYMQAIIGFHFPLHMGHSQLIVEEMMEVTHMHVSAIDLVSIIIRWHMTIYNQVIRRKVLSPWL